MTTKTGVIYLQKDKFQIISPFLNAVLEFRFTPAMVQDLDVLNDELLEATVKDFVTKSKIPPSNLIIILSDNAYFLKDFPFAAPPPAKPEPGKPPVPVKKTSVEDLQPQIDLFVEHVPYENVVSKNFTLKNGIRVCAVNQDLYKTIQVAFEKLGFTIDIVLPGLTLGGGLSAKPVLDKALASIALQKAPVLKQYNLQSQEAFSAIKKEPDAIDEVQNAMETSGEPPKTNKKRMIFMVGVLIVLIVILVIVTIQSMQPPTPAKKQVTAKTATAKPTIVTPTAVPTPEQVTTAQTKDLKVQIIYSTDTTAESETLRDELKEYTFKSVSAQKQTNVGSAKTVVSFSSDVEQIVRNAVLDKVREVESDVTVQDLEGSTYNVSILLGK